MERLMLLAFPALRMLRQILALTLFTFLSCTKAPAPASSGEPYEVKFTSPSPFVAGKESSALVLVKAGPGLHVNPEYPVAFKPEGSEAVKFAQERVPLTPGTKTPCAEKAEDACAVEFALPLTPEKAGLAKVAGVLAFSVCSAEKCLIEKVPLTLAIKVE